MFKEYVATAEFHLNLDGGKSSLTVRKGDLVLFDGVMAECKGQKGSAPSLGSVVGSWIHQKGSRNAEKSESSVKDSGVKDVSNDTVLAKALSAEVQHPINRKIVENSDASIIKQVSKQAFVGSESNAPAVEIDKQENTPRKVISEEQRVVKQTNTGAKPVTEKKAKRQVLNGSDSEGQEVRKVTAAPVRNKDEVTEKTIIKDESVSKETSYEKTSGTDIGSSTQTKTTSVGAGALPVENMKDLADALNTADTVKPKRVIEHSDPSPMTKDKIKELLDEQNRTVVKKTGYKKIPTETTAEGIQSSVSVGSPEEPEITAKVSKSDEGISGLEAVVSKSDSDTSEYNQDAVVVSQIRKASVEEDEDVNIQQLLEEVDTNESSVQPKEITKVEDLSMDGEPWSSLHWKQKVALIKTLDNKELLKQILNGDFPPPFKTAAEKRLSEVE